MNKIFYERTLIDFMCAAIIVTDAKGIVTDCNQASSMLTGYTCKEMIGSHFKNYFTDPELIHKSIHAAVLEVETIGKQIAVRSRSGNTRVINFNIYKIYDNKDEERIIFSAGKDITEKNAIEEHIRNKNMELEMALLIKERFLTSMSHQLRTPLNAIIGFSDILLMKLSGRLDTEQESHLRIINENGKFLLTLIEELFEVAKMDSEKLIAKTQRQVNQNKITVLIIDDHPSNLKLMAYLLKQDGHRILTAASGLQGIEIANKERPDIVLCDIQLPSLNGYEVLKQLRMLPHLKQLPIIAVSAYVMEEDKIKALKAGFNGFISKPIDTIKFVTQIRDYLESSEY